MKLVHSASLVCNREGHRRIRHYSNSTTSASTKSDEILRTRHIAKAALDTLASDLNIQSQADWYAKLTHDNLEQATKGIALLSLYDGSWAKMFNQAYPEAPNEWVEWGFKHRSLPAGFWTNFKTQRDFAAWVEREKGMTSPRDWYSIRQKDLTELGGVSLLQRHYKGSVFALVKALRPDHKWLEWEFSQTPQGFWNNVQNQRRFLDWAGGELGIASMEDWYKISKAQVVKLGGSTLFGKYSSSFSRCIKAVYSGHQWDDWRWRDVPVGFWSSVKNRRLFMEWAAAQLGINNLSGWYKVKYTTLKKLGGGTLFSSYYNNSMFTCLKDVYPEHQWLEWQFNVAPTQFWDSRANQLRFVEWAGKELGITSLSGWYSVSRTKFSELGGGGLFLQYPHRSLIQCLKELYPTHEWKEWKHSVVGVGFWKSLQNQRQFMDWVSEELKFKSKEDWYSVVVTETLYNLGGGSLVNVHYRGSLAACLNAVYPEHKFLPWKFVHSPRGMWDSIETQREFLTFAAMELGFGGDIQGWQNVSVKQFNAVPGGSNLLALYDYSLTKLLQAAYPQIDWSSHRTT